MSFTKNAEAEILTNLGIISNQNFNIKECHRDSISDIKEASNRTRLLSSSNNDKSSLTFDSDDDDGMVVFNNSTLLQNDYSNKIIKMSNWESYLIALPIILFMNYLIGVLYSLPEIYKNELYGFSSASIIGIAIGWYTSSKLFEKHNSIKIIFISVSLAYIFLVLSTILTGFIQYVAVIVFVTQVFLFTKGSLLILLSSSTDSKTFFLIYFFIALGGLIAPIAVSTSLSHVTRVELNTQRLLTKRDISTILETNNLNKTIENINTLKSNFSNNDLTSTTYTSENQLTKILKPDSVIGVSENQDKKTEENVLQRAAAEEKRKKDENESQENSTTIQSSTESGIITKSTSHEYEEISTTSSVKEILTTTQSTVQNVEDISSTTNKLEIDKSTEIFKSTTTSKNLNTIKVISNEGTKLIPAPYKLNEKFIFNKNALLQSTLLIAILSILPSSFFAILHIFKIKSLSDHSMFKYGESKTYPSIPMKSLVLSYVIWLLLSIIEATFSYCQINKMNNDNRSLLQSILPILILLLSRFLGIFYSQKYITKRIIHCIQILSIGYIVQDNQLNSQFLIGILGFLIGSIAPMYFIWISKMIQKHTITLLNHFISIYLGSVLVAKVLYTYLLKDTDEGKIENSLYIILMLLIILEICFAFLSLHLSSFYRQTEIARLTNSLSGNGRKQNGDISFKAKKSKYGYKRLINDTENQIDSLIESDSDSNDEIFS